MKISLGMAGATKRQGSIECCNIHQYWDAVTFDVITALFILDIINYSDGNIGQKDFGMMP